jgi:hypothetical protein
MQVSGAIPERIVVAYEDALGNAVDVSAANALPTTSAGGGGGFGIPAYDYVALAYTGSNLTGVTYRTGGASGTIVATLTLAYSGSNVTSVTKS